MPRPLCKECGKRPRAINYVRNDKTYYRSKCTECLAKQKRQKPFKPRWQQKGYKKKMTCDLCGFRAKYPQQIEIYHIDGNLDNCTFTNLKNVCRNCMVELEKQDLPWRRGDLVRDF